MLRYLYSANALPDRVGKPDRDVDLRKCLLDKGVELPALEGVEVPMDEGAEGITEEASMRKTLMMRTYRTARLYRLVHL